MASDLPALTVSTTEAARLLGISRPTVYELLRQNAFPSFQVGTRRLIPVAGLQAWVAAQSEPDASTVVVDPLGPRHTDGRYHG